MSMFGIGAIDHRKLAAWRTTRPLSGLLAYVHPQDEARLDEEGHIIYWSHYGRHESEYGWEIDHRLASALGGSDAIGNLRARHCKTNRSHGGLLAAMLKQR